MTIDNKVCLKHGLTTKEVFLLLTLKTGNYMEDISNLEARQIISLKENHYEINPQWGDILEKILNESSESQDEEERLLSLAKQMRELFPKGKMPGTAFYYRCNNREVVLKLKKFFIQYGQYSDEEILNATKKFIASFHGELRYMPLIKYFISKNKRVEDENGEFHIQETSELASYLENEDLSEDIEEDDDWLLTSKN